MDRFELAAKIVIAAGLAFIWPGPAVMQWVGTPDPAWPPPATVVPATAPRASGPSAAVSSDEAARAWFVAAKPTCNAVEARSSLERRPPPAGWWGEAYAAACLALGGLTEDARARLDALSPDEQWQAAGVVFDVGHPAADAGDDVAAGPLMELVVAYWPNHYMALYHAGAARFERGDPDGARPYLESFLFHYEPDDGWRARALEMLRRAPGG